MTNVWILLTMLGCGTQQAPTTPEIQPAVPEAPQPEPQAAEHPDATACDVQLFAYESDPAGLTIYAAPKRGAEEVGVYPVDTEVTVTQSTGPWAHVRPTHEGSGLVRGWVGIELLTTNLRSPEEYGANTQPTFRAKPDSGEATKRIALPIDSITITGCEGSFLKADWVDGKGSSRTGWLDASAHCPQPNTTCE